MAQLKPLKPELIAQALAKAERYRLLNEPAESESICRDVLAADPDNQQALIWLLLSLTDQFHFHRHGVVREAHKLLHLLNSEYEQKYFAGVIAERHGKTKLRSHAAGSGFAAYHLIHEAMELYEEAERLSAADNDDAKLRYNSCVRLLEAHPELRPEPSDDYEPSLLE